MTTTQSASKAARKRHVAGYDLKRARWVAEQKLKFVEGVREYGCILTAFRCAEIPEKVGLKYLEQGKREREAFFDGRLEDPTELGQFYQETMKAMGEFTRNFLQKVNDAGINDKTMPTILKLRERLDPDLFAPRPAPRSPQVVVRNENVQQTAIAPKLPEPQKPVEAGPKVRYKPIVLDGDDFEERRIPNQEDAIETKFLPSASVVVDPLEVA